MKKCFLLIAAAVVLLNACRTASSVTSSSHNVPAAVHTSFSTQYPGASGASWLTNTDVPIVVERDFVGWPSASNNDHVVRFRMDDVDYYAWYNADGKWIGTASAVANHSILPDAIQTAINRDYSNFTISSVNKQWRGDQLAYEIEMKNNNSKAKLLIDESGKVIKSKVKTND